MGRGMVEGEEELLRSNKSIYTVYITPCYSCVHFSYHFSICPLYVLALGTLDMQEMSSRTSFMAKR